MGLKNNNIIRLLTELTKTVASIGHNNTVNLLRKNQIENIVDYAGIVDYIWGVVTNTFYISKKEIISGKSRGARTDALCVICHCFSFYMKLKYEEIAIEVNKTISQVSQYTSRIKNLQSHITYDKHLMKKLEEIEDKIRIYMDSKCTKDIEDDLSNEII